LARQDLRRQRLTQQDLGLPGARAARAKPGAAGLSYDAGQRPQPRAAQGRAHGIAVTGEPRQIGVAQALRARRAQAHRPVRAKELGCPSKETSPRSDGIISAWPCAPCADSASIVRAIRVLLAEKIADQQLLFERGLQRNLRRQGAPRASRNAFIERERAGKRSMTRRGQRTRQSEQAHPFGRRAPRDRRPQAPAPSRVRSSRPASCETKAIEGDRSTSPHRMRRFHRARAHRRDPRRAERRQSTLARRLAGRNGGIARRSRRARARRPCTPCITLCRSPCRDDEAGQAARPRSPNRAAKAGLRGRPRKTRTTAAMPQRTVLATRRAMSRADFRLPRARESEAHAVLEHGLARRRDIVLGGREAAVDQRAGAASASISAWAGARAQAPS